MDTPYSLAVIHELEAEAGAAGPLRPFRRLRYEPGDVIEAEVTGVASASRAQVRLEVEKFVGGGFAGQVYRVTLTEISPAGVAGLEVGRSYAVKALVPPSRFARLFRNFIYWLAYQGPFSAQVNPAASRVGVLWQKLVRRGARVRLGREEAVVDTYATFFLPELETHAEINEWVPGRTWRYEIDDRLALRRRFDPSDPEKVLEESASKEYLGKRLFMHRLVELLHEMGAPELARQYEWWTCKSQPNALKRLDAEDGPMEGLTAIDFRAGLALLATLPMSPGDFRLIVAGLRRGNLVQFDRGNLEQLEAFVKTHQTEFEDLLPALAELVEAERTYRRSLVDITHHAGGLLTDRELRQSVRDGLLQGYRCADLLDAEHAERLRASGGRFALFYLAGAVPLLGAFGRRLWGNSRYRAHKRKMLGSWGYAKQALRSRMAESLISWHRTGRAGAERTQSLLRRPVSFWLQRFTLGILPAAWHRWLAEPSYAWSRIREGISYGLRFYRDAEFRQEWLTEQIEAGREEGMLSAEEEQEVLECVEDPYIAKYLKSVAVHVCTVPVTQLFSLGVAIYAYFAFGQTWAESLAYALGVLAAFQIMPISPGSITRGSYVVYLMIKERNWRNYWVAALISFWKYIGYLGFPIQMVKQYPVLARLMAGRQATSLVHFIPVFGEKGALLEHWIFDLFFNLPISVGRRLRRKPSRTGAEDGSTV